MAITYFNQGVLGFGDVEAGHSTIETKRKKDKRALFHVTDHEYFLFPGMGWELGFRSS